MIVNSSEAFVGSNQLFGRPLALVSLPTFGGMALHVVKATRKSKAAHHQNLKKRDRDVKRVQASKKDSAKEGMTVCRSIDVFQNKCERAKGQVGV